ncbi:hypothetical protein [Ferruginibacter sp.]
MRFFAKIVFICNLCFVASVILRFVEKKYAAKGITDHAIPLPFLEGTIAVLGELAMIINIFFCVIALILILMKKIKQIPLWIVIFNFIILLAQVYWFFIDNSK